VPPPRWSPDHLRLHRSLLRQPELLPRGASLLLAVSGGQDSMAMVGLLQALQPLHHWRLQLWHGDHRWRRESADQAEALRSWAVGRGLPIRVECMDAIPAGSNREAAARLWRYACLRREALRLGCGHVLTAHTATDRAETVLLHLARGSHRRGLASLRRRTPLEVLLQQGQPGLGPAGWVAPAAGQQPQDRLAPVDTAGSRVQDIPARGDAALPVAPLPLWLVRPLQLFSREDTERICRDQDWPVWEDPSNAQLQLSRNRIRARVLPVLEELHPGAARRISEQAERLALEQEQQLELLDLALIPLLNGPLQLDRSALLQRSEAVQGLLLQHWLRGCHGRELDSRSLASLLPRLPLPRGSGRMDLAAGWQLSWRGTTLALRPPTPPAGHGRFRPQQ